MAYLLDTNVLSELRKRARASAKVMAWYRSVIDGDLFISVVTIGEIRRGIELKRRRDPKQAGHLEH